MIILYVYPSSTNNQPQCQQRTAQVTEGSSLIGHLLPCGKRNSCSYWWSPPSPFARTFEPLRIPPRARYRQKIRGGGARVRVRVRHVAMDVFGPRDEAETKTDGAPAALRARSAYAFDGGARPIGVWCTGGQRRD